MIGVLSKQNEVKTVREFFELFKTPWEMYVPHRRYDVVITTCGEIPEDLDARLLVVYSSLSIGFDAEIGVATQSTQRCDWLEWQGAEFPIYGDVAVFRAIGRPLLRRRATLEMVGIKIVRPGCLTIRIGFDLFWEVAFLLSQGQPPGNGPIPTLETLISLLRAMMVSAGVTFVEVPAVPAGYDFMGCLTHDVDFIGIRDHKFDHTMWGFLYRCFVGSLIRAVRGKLEWSKCLLNWKAALSLPLVHLGLRDDFWLEFDRYTQIEQKLGSTFFFIPFKNVAGTQNSHGAPRRRAAKYDVAGMKGQFVELVKHGGEVGLHGIDAWQNVEKAAAELHRIREVTGQLEMGVRMHWLYWAENSPQALEKAGFEYDSTFGYNDAIGFRAGTTQAFCPLGALTLLELPLNIQDTALFYSDRMKLSETDALELCKRLIHSMSCYGGALTVNWHTRSLSPERLWGDFYAKLLAEIQKRRVWFGTAKEVVQWFRRRRALRFDSVQFRANRVRLALSSTCRPGEPSLTVRIYHSDCGSGDSESLVGVLKYTDAPWNGEEVLETGF